MASVSIFRARYTDETALYEHLRSVFPSGTIQIRVCYETRYSLLYGGKTDILA